MAESAKPSSSSGTTECGNLNNINNINNIDNIDDMNNIKSSNNEKVNDEITRKQTVLESHGYFLGEIIGSGSYATVKVANSHRHECRVAVKIVSKFQAPSDYLNKFLPREIKVAKGLKHPNLIKFLQAIETTHRVYIIMEFAENGSLLDIIRRDSYIDEIRSRKWFIQLLNAIEYCHERGVVHRDIKCENLLMDQHLNLKLSDFGFARGLAMKGIQNVGGGGGGGASACSALLSETFCGSYAYASPEILRGIPYEPHLSDIWSLGVVLYAMVFGRLPFDDTNYAQLLKQVQSKVSFPKLPKVSYACKALINKILVPQRARAKIFTIKNDPWLVIPMISVETSISNKSLLMSQTNENTFVPTKSCQVNESS